MKRLRVVLVSLIVALLCWYPSQHVCCSEQSLPGSGPSAQDNEPESLEQEQDSTHNKEVEEWATQTSYKMGLEMESAAQAKQEYIHYEQTVNVQEDEVKEAKPEPDLEIIPAALEPAPTPESQADLDLQTYKQDQDQEAAVSPTPETTLDHRPTESLPQTETSSDDPAGNLSLDSNSLTPPDEAENVPTSQNSGPAHTREDDQLSSQSSDVDMEVKSNPEVTDFKQQEQQELDLKDNASLPHQDEFQMGDTEVKEADPSVPSKDDFHTFDEWRKQVMEKSQTLHTSTSGSPHPVKKVQKNFKNNYASVECGAKILSANNEAKSTSAILMENMDLYMLNPCGNKIWFVIELCEPIQVKQLDIANFELFSSTPKDFLVSISDRYPTNKWVKLGTFHARDERIVQSFPLDEQLYAKYVKMFIKYIKIELLSHFGSEHFCPLSLFRVFGTSMVEEYEEIADSQYPSERLEYLDEDYDYPPGYQPSEEKASKNLLGSATNAILNMVNNIAANMLGGKQELEGEAETGGNTTAEGSVNESTEVKAEPDETLHDSTVVEPSQSEEPATKESFVSVDSSQLSESHEDRQIVILVEEEEDEDLNQSTVILLEEEGEEEEEEEEKRDNKSRREADRNQWESQTYCPFSSLSSLSLSCVATLPELLHRWCSARLAKERLRSFRKRQLSSRTLVHPDVHSPVPTHTPPPVLTPAPSEHALPLTEHASELEVPSEGLDEGSPLSDVHAADVQMNTQSPDAHTPDSILLEPSKASTIPTDSFSDFQSTLVQPTPTYEERSLPAATDEALDPVPTPPLQTVSVPETQQASSATLTTSVSSPSQPLASEKELSSIVVPSVNDQPVLSHPTASRPEDLTPSPTEGPAVLLPPDIHTDSSGEDNGGDMQIQNIQTPPLQVEQGDSLSQTEPHQVEDTVEGDLLNTSGNQRTATDFYAELQNGVDYNGGTGNGILVNGGAVHGSSQKESVFMRLNNRIKALEMNMSLSSRYLEELSQRYRKQMEEMQKAFNKTIIKLQNTSRIAEEQDQKQTESIQILQSQLEDVTKLMLNLTATVNQLQREVSDGQSYLLVSLVLCLLLGLLLCLQYCRSSFPSPKTTTVAPPKSNHYPSPKRCFSSYDDMSLKRRVACPLVRSKSFQLSSTEVGPDDLFIVEPLKFSPEKKKKRGKTKSLDKVETLRSFGRSLTLTNGILNCNGFHPSLPAPPPPPPALPAPPPPLPLPPPLPSSNEASSLPPCPSKEFPSETSSCSSSTHSEESYTSCLPLPSPIFTPASMCNGHGLSVPLSQFPAKSRHEKRSTKRRKSRQTELQFPHEPGGGISSLPSLQQLMKGNKEISVGTIGVTAITGHV